MNKVNWSILRQYMFESPEATIEETDILSPPPDGVLQNQICLIAQHTDSVTKTVLLPVL